MASWSDAVVPGGPASLVAAFVVVAALAVTLVPRLVDFLTLVPRLRATALVVLTLFSSIAAVMALLVDDVSDSAFAGAFAAACALGALHLVVHCYRRAESENEEERRRSEGLFVSAPEAIVLVGLDRRIIRVNAAWTRMFGWTETEVRGQLIDELVAPPDRLEEARGISHTVNSGGEVDLDTVRRRKDGTLVEVSVLVNRIAVGGGRFAIYGIYLDISARKEAERRLRENEELLELFFSQSLDGFFFAMADTPFAWGPEVDKAQAVRDAFEHTRVIKVNDAMLAQYGANRSQMLGRSIAEFFAGNETEGLRNLRDLFDQGWSHAESRERRMDGTSILIEGDYRLLRDEQGRILGHFGIQGDVSARRRAEEELRASRRQLRELAARLQAVREEERTVLAREVHDEFGQLLTGLKLELAWIRRHLPAGQRDLELRLEDTLALIAQGVDSVRRIIASLRPSLLDDLGLVAALEWQAKEFAARSGLDVRFDPGAEEITLDPEQSITLFRICQEALTNVARHAAARKVQVTLRGSTHAVTLEVRDDGRGVSDDELHAADPATLGLVGMRERAIACGGSLAIEGSPGRGTLVSVSIPLRRSAPYQAISGIGTHST